MAPVQVGHDLGPGAEAFAERDHLGFRAIINARKMGNDHIAFAEVKLSDTRDLYTEELSVLSGYLIARPLLAKPGALPC